jgi:hypothetical protein
VINANEKIQSDKYLGTEGDKNKLERHQTLW